MKSAGQFAIAACSYVKITSYSYERQQLKIGKQYMITHLLFPLSLYHRGTKQTVEVQWQVYQTVLWLNYFSFFVFQIMILTWRNELTLKAGIRKFNLY